MTTVVHCKKDKFDVYIGRPDGPGFGEWGNPFSSKPHAKADFRTHTKGETLWRHREWVLSQPELIRRIKQELKGKILG